MGVFITLMENILNHYKLSHNTKNIIDMLFIVPCEYARVKSKPINELENLPQAEIVRYFCCSYQQFMKNNNQ